MNALITLTAILAITQALSLSEVEKQQWENFRLVYGKQYQNQDEANMRKKIFVQNLHKFQEHNKKYEEGLVSYTLGVNQFADMTSEEFVKTLAPINATAVTGRFPFVPLANVDVPASIDWRDKGAVTPVTDSCASYAVSAAGALEGQLFLKTGKLVSLSEQTLIDCTVNYGNSGCNGSPLACFRYVQQNGGINTEESYPYENKSDECRYDPKQPGVTIHGVGILPKDDEDALLTAVGTIGPISIGLNGKGIHSYVGGVFSSECDPTTIDHFALVVGYGTTDDGEDYWIVKNCWGEQYGIGGYILLARNKNQCGIASQATFPVA